MDGAGPPPPPPRHGENPKTTAGGHERRGGLPDGNYDIFIVPPHSAGSGFLYLPSLQNQRNCLIVGQLLGCVEAMVLWKTLPAMFGWFRDVIAPGGGAIVLLLVFVSVVSYFLGKMQGEQSGGSGPEGPHAESTGPPPQANGGAGSWGSGGSSSSPPPEPEPEPRSKPDAQTKWEQARDETKRKAEQQRREDDARKKKEEDEKKAKADATKRAWEAKRQQQKEEREKLERDKRLAEERAAREKKRAEERAEREKREAAAKAKKEAEEKAAKEKLEREIREKLEKEMEDSQRRSRSESPRKPTFGVGERTNPYASDAGSEARRATSSSPRKPYQFPTATSASGTESAYSYRPYDQASSVFSDSTYMSASTARTSPSEFSGPFVPRHPEQIILKAVFKFTSHFPNRPVSQLRAGMDRVSDGLVLRIESEGLFIDDERRNIPQREWDLKTWTLKAIETGSKSPYHVVRAALRDTTEGKTFVFIFAESESWKLAKGLQKLKSGPQMRPVNTNKLSAGEVKTILVNTGMG